jgi:hypothetical protein
VYCNSMKGAARMHCFCHSSLPGGWRMQCPADDAPKKVREKADTERACKDAPGGYNHP